MRQGWSFNGREESVASPPLEHTLPQSTPLQSQYSSESSFLRFTPHPSSSSASLHPTERPPATCSNKYPPGLHIPARHFTALPPSPSDRDPQPHHAEGAQPHADPAPPGLPRLLAGVRPLGAPPGRGGAAKGDLAAAPRAPPFR